MRYYKLINNGYIDRIGTGIDGEEITEEEYNTIFSVIQNKPQRTETTDFRLKSDLTWEEHEVPPIPTSEPDAEEILDILMGVEE